MKLVPKVGFKKWSTNFRFEHSNWKNERFTPGNFSLERPDLFNWILTKRFVSGRQPKNENNRGII